MIRGLDVESIVLLHGRAMRGKKVVTEILAWLKALECSTDLTAQDAHRAPSLRP